MPKTKQTKLGRYKATYKPKRISKSKTKQLYPGPPSTKGQRDYAKKLKFKNPSAFNKPTLGYLIHIDRPVHRKKVGNPKVDKILKEYGVQKGK